MSYQPTPDEQYSKGYTAGYEYALRMAATVIDAQPTGASLYQNSDVARAVTEFKERIVDLLDKRDLEDIAT